MNCLNRLSNFNSTVGSKVVFYSYLKIFSLGGIFPFKIIGESMIVNKIKYSYSLLLIFFFTYNLIDFTIITLKYEINIIGFINQLIMVLGLALLVSLELLINSRLRLLNIFIFKFNFQVNLNLLILPFVHVTLKTIFIIFCWIFTKANSFFKFRIILSTLLNDFVLLSFTTEFVFFLNTVTHLLPDLNEEWSHFRKKYLTGYLLYKKITDTNQPVLLCAFLVRGIRAILLSYTIVNNRNLKYISMNAKLVQLIDYMVEDLWFFWNCHSFTNKVFLI